jgi:hypothetical protein
VLVVDDNATNRKIAVRMLGTLGHRTDVAANGMEAAVACAEVAYDLVLMDCRMPVMDGYEATQLIRAAEGATRRTPVVAMTASTMVADRQRCLDVGMDDFLSKPVRLADIADTVDRWITDPQQLDPGLGVLDETVVAGLFGLGAAFVAQLVPVFAEAVPGRVSDLRTAIRHRDAAALSTAAHGLGGSAANMGGLRVAAACTRLEDAGLTGRLDGADADLRLVEAEVTVMLDALASLVDGAQVRA